MKKKITETNWLWSNCLHRNYLQSKSRLNGTTTVRADAINDGEESTRVLALSFLFDILSVEVNFVDSAIVVNETSEQRNYNHERPKEKKREKNYNIFERNERNSE